MKYRLVDASASDEPWLDDLRRRAYAELFSATWGVWDEDRHRRPFAACMERGHVSVIEVDDRRVGMIQLLDAPDGLEIAEVQVDPSHQGRGIGTAVVRDVISVATSRGLSVRLRVGVKNQGAIRLYERLGFDVMERSNTHCVMRHPAGS